MIVIFVTIVRNVGMIVVMIVWVIMVMIVLIVVTIFGKSFIIFFAHTLS